MACITASPTSLNASNIPSPGLRIVSVSALVYGLLPPVPSCATLPGCVSLGDNRYQADYSYGTGTHTCHGSAVVTIVQRDGRTYVEEVRAPRDSCS